MTTTSISPQSYLENVKFKHKFSKNECRIPTQRTLDLEGTLLRGFSFSETRKNIKKMVACNIFCVSLKDRYFLFYEQGCDTKIEPDTPL